MAATCGEACGWLAAVASCLAFGSFGVPIKSRVAQTCDIDPLVMQSYKTFMCFATSWLLLVGGESFEFTPWGIVSGLFWVPGGVATIYAVKSAGLAIGIGIGSSFIVLVSFVWGIFVFHEDVRSKMGACTAIFFMMLGLMGMSYYSSPEEGVEEGVSNSVQYQGVAMSQDGSDREDDDDDEEDGLAIGGGSSNMARQQIGDGLHVDKNLALTDRTAQTERTTISDYPDSDYVDDSELTEGELEERPNQILPTHDEDDLLEESPVELIPTRVFHFTKRQYGMMAAAFCGLWGGSIMAPMKLCRANTQGTHYLLSFSIGASIVTIALWIIRYVWNVAYYKSFGTAYNNLPSFYFRKMWLAGGTCGLVWSIGNFFSLISVFYLGEGVGYPLVQTSILVSGLWGIFYFKEVSGSRRITLWLASSCLTIFGILLLSYEHVESK